MKRTLFFVVFILIINSTYCQLKWERLPDSFTLTRNVYYFDASIDINDILVGGEVGIDVIEKRVIYQNKEISLKFERKDIRGVSLPDFGILTYDQIFSDSILKQIEINFRKKLYLNLDLNEIEFSSSQLKRKKFSLNGTNIEIKDEKKLKGKLCYADLNLIIILDEEGTLNNLKNQDFIFLSIDNKKFLDTKSFYSYLYDDYQSQLLKNINKWKAEIMQQQIEAIISRWGPLDKSINITSTKRMLIWEKQNKAIKVNLSSGSQSSKFTYSDISAYQNKNTFSTLSFSRVPSLFYLDSYTSSITNLSSSLFSNTISTSITNYLGMITSEDKTTKLSILINSDNKIEDVLTDNFFANPIWGSSFRFIHF